MKKKYTSFDLLKNGELFIFFNKDYSPSKMFVGIYLGENKFFVLKHFKDAIYNNTFEDWNYPLSSQFIKKL